MVMALVGLLIASVGLVAALVALVIACWQIRDARRASRLEGEIIALEAFLAAELAGQRDPARIERLLELIFSKVEQLGVRDVREAVDAVRR